MFQARLGGLVFEGGDGPAEYDIAPDGLRGWFEGVDLRTERYPRPSANGYFPSEVLRGGRTITMKGQVHSRGAVDQERSFARLTGLLSDGLQGRLNVQTENGMTWADVELDDKVEITTLIYGQTAEYRLQLWAPDPIRYGDKNTFAPGAAVYHKGNAPSFPVVTVVGPRPAYSISAGGKSFPISQALTAGQTHEVFLKTGAVFRNGIKQSGVTTAPVRWSVAPGQELVHTISGSGTASIDLFDAFN